MRGGDISEGNLWLAGALLQLFRDFQSSWLYKYSNLVGMAFYAFLRLITDHGVNKVRVAHREVR